MAERLAAAANVMGVSPRTVRRLVKQYRVSSQTTSLVAKPSGPHQKRRRLGPTRERIIDEALETHYLIIDCFDGLVVSWSLGTTPDAELVNAMLDTAIETVANGSNRTIVHSDRGAHYRWPGWLSRIDGARLIRSMSRKACSPDNAACEGFFGRLKNELFYPGSWQSTTIEHFIAEVDSYIRWYNEQRIKMSLGSRSPMEYRANLGYAT